MLNLLDLIPEFLDLGQQSGPLVIPLAVMVLAGSQHLVFANLLFNEGSQFVVLFEQFLIVPENQLHLGFQLGYFHTLGFEHFVLFFQDSQVSHHQFLDPLRVLVEFAVECLPPAWAFGVPRS